MFKNVTEVFILVPALLGLKGNLEMTLASRLSTAVSFSPGVFSLVLSSLHWGDAMQDTVFLLSDVSLTSGVMAALTA